jgi:hypothetical protein
MLALGGLMLAFLALGAAVLAVKLLLGLVLLPLKIGFGLINPSAGYACCRPDRGSVCGNDQSARLLASQVSGTVRPDEQIQERYRAVFCLVAEHHGPAYLCQKGGKARRP